MHKKIIYYLFLLFLISSAKIVYACDCKPIGSVQQEFDKHDVVFLGMVLELIPAGVLRPGYNIVRLKPIKRYKGMSYIPNLDVVTVFTPMSKKACGIKFNRRIDYLVFASGNPAFLKVDSCSRTGVQEDKKEELKVLESIYKKTVKK